MTGRPWTAASRVEKLLAERDALGRPLVFVEASEGGAVHVVGPDEDQPNYENIAAYLLSRRYRTVCGTTLHLSPLDSYVIGWDDLRLCRRCAAGFGRVHIDAGAAIFEDKDREDAPSLVARIQRDKADEADRAAEEAA